MLYVCLPPPWTSITRCLEQVGSPMSMYLRGVKEHLVMHLDLPQDPRDFSVGHGHEHHVMDAKKWH